MTTTDTDTDEQSGIESIPISRRGAMATIVTTLGLAGLTGQVSGQSDIGTATNPYRRLYVDQGVVFLGVTDSSGLPEGTLHVRSDQV